MGMNVGGGGDGKVPAPQMNVTPLVDVVLCLLIIFMVITPLMTKTFWVHAPKQEKEETPPDQPPDPTPPLVMRVGPTNEIQVNGVALSLAEIPDRLRRMFAAREDHVIFFDADDAAEYGVAVQAMDKAREGGAVTIATLTRAIGAPAPGADPATATPPSPPPAN